MCLTPATHLSVPPDRHTGPAGPTEASPSYVLRYEHLHSSTSAYATRFLLLLLLLLLSLLLLLLLTRRTLVVRVGAGALHHLELGRDLAARAATPCLTAATPCLTQCKAPNLTQATLP